MTGEARNGRNGSEKLETNIDRVTNYTKKMGPSA